MKQLNLFWRWLTGRAHRCFKCKKLSLNYMVCFDYSHICLHCLHGKDSSDQLQQLPTGETVWKKASEQ